MKLKISLDKSIELLKTIPHKACLQAIDKHWKSYLVGKNEMRAQGVCWLFCWAKEGKGSIEAKTRVIQIFDKIFEYSFDFFASKVTHEWAKCNRYSPSKDLDRQLEDMLNA